MSTLTIGRTFTPAQHSASGQTSCGEIKGSTGERKPSGGENSRSTLKGETPRRKVRLRAVNISSWGNGVVGAMWGKHKMCMHGKKSGK